MVPVRGLRKKTKKEKNIKHNDRLMIPIDREQKARLKEIADSKDLNVSQLCRRIIDQYLKKQEIR